jgi:bla regulator protein blaR1
MRIVEDISNPMFHALGWMLLHSLWQVLAIALLWRVAMHLARKASANIRYHLSLVALLAIPVVAAITFSRQYSIYANASRIVSVEFEDALYAASGGTGQFYLVQKNYPAMLAQFDAWTPYLFWIYLAGLTVFSIVTILNYSRLYALRFRGVKPLPAAWQKKLSALKARAGILKNIGVFQSERISVPAVVGFFRPVILLPLSMLTTLSPQQIEAILLHELYHIRRKDHIINLLQNLLEILFFYHPATWWISRSLREEREKRVDEWVVAHTGTPLIYAQALVTLEQKRTATLQPVVAATQSKNLLLTRVKNIMTMKTRTFNPGQKMAAMLVILTAAISVAWLNPAMTVNYGHPGPEYLMDPVTAGSSEVLAKSRPAPALLETVTTPEGPVTAPQPPAQPEQPQAEAPPKPRPRSVFMQDGKAIYWEDLAPEDQARLQKAMDEMRWGMREVNRELQQQFNSDEFRQQMREAGVEMRRAMQEAREKMDAFNSEEFREEMRKASEEFRRASEEARLEFQQFRSEEFREEMKKSREEMRRAMEEMRIYLEEKGYEFRDIQEMRDEMDWDSFNRDMEKSMKSLEESLRHIGPSIEKAMESIEMDKIMQSVFDSLEKAFPEGEHKSRKKPE